MSQNWNRRYRANMEKIKTGDIFEVAEVVRNLSARDREKGLSTGERKMLENARQILISELVLAQDTTEEDVETAAERNSGEEGCRLDGCTSPCYYLPRHFGFGAAAVVCLTYHFSST